MSINNSVVPLSSIANERTTGIDVPSVADFRNDRLGTKISGRHREMLSLRHGTSLGRFSNAPVPDNGFLEQFRTKNRTPRSPEVFHVTEHQTNTVHPITRNVKQQAPMFGWPHPYELLIMFKNPEHRANPLYHRDSGLMIECNPLDEFTPAVFNYLETRRQRALYESRDPEVRAAYMQQSPSDVWKHYIFEGVIETEAPAMRAGQFGAQFTRHVLNDKGDMVGGKTLSARSSGLSVMSEQTTIDGSRLMTVNVKGPAFVFNYWGANIEPGAKLYAIIKKYAPEQDFVLAREAGALTRSIESTTASITQHEFFRPFQMGFFCLPPGTRNVPRELLEYIDEYGHMHYDGLPIFLGTVATVPADHKFIDIDLRYVKPYSGESQKSTYESTHLMQVLFDTCTGAYLL